MQLITRLCYGCRIFISVFVLSALFLVTPATAAEILAIGPRAGDFSAFLKPQSSQSYATLEDTDLFVEQLLQDPDAHTLLVDDTLWQTLSARLQRRLQATLEVYPIPFNNAAPDMLKQLQATADFLDVTRSRRTALEGLTATTRELQLRLGTVPIEAELVYLMTATPTPAEEGLDLLEDTPPAYTLTFAGREDEPTGTLHLAGGYNLLWPHAAHVTLTEEEAAAFQPAYVLVGRATLKELGGSETLVQHPIIQAMGITDTWQILTVDDKGYTAFGPYSVKAALDLAIRLFPEVDFNDIKY